MKKNNVEQKSDKWLHDRKGKITGTLLKDIMGTPYKRKEAYYAIIASKLTEGIEDKEENDRDRGNRLEPEAIAAFEFETDLSTEVVGMIESDESKDIAQSPDRYIKDKDDTEAIEVKCPAGKNYVKLWLTNEIPDDYKWQCVQYFVVNPKLKKLYFVGYNPLIAVHPIHIIEVTRETFEEEIGSALEAQHKILREINNKLLELIEL